MQWGPNLVCETMGVEGHMQLQTLVIAAQVVATLHRHFRRQQVRANAELPEVKERLALHHEVDTRFGTGGCERRRNWRNMTASCRWVL